MRARAEDLAFFVVHAGISPSEYWGLTGYEREALIEVLKKKYEK